MLSLCHYLTTLFTFVVTMSLFLSSIYNCHCVTISQHCLHVLSVTVIVSCRVVSCHCRCRGSVSWWTDINSLLGQVTMTMRQKSGQGWTWWLNLTISGSDPTNLTSSRCVLGHLYINMLTLDHCKCITSQVPGSIAPFCVHCLPWTIGFISTIGL